MKKSSRLILLFCAVLVIVLIAVLVFVQRCNDCDPKKVVLVKQKPTSRSRVVGPGGTAGPILRNEWHKVLVVSSGPGSFISAVVSKKGGSGGSLSDTIKTTVRLRLDRKQVVIKSFEVARAMGLSTQNYSGVVWLDGEDDIETMVLGFQESLFFTGVLELSVKVDDPQVEALLLNLTYLKEDTGEDEDTGGGDGEPPWPPP